MSSDTQAGGVGKTGHTPGPWSVAAGSHVCVGWSGMIPVESVEDFHSNGHEYPDGGSTRSYTNVVCGISGHSDTARANAHLISAIPDLYEACKKAYAAIGAVGLKLSPDAPPWQEPLLEAFAALRAAATKSEGKV